MKQSNKSLNLDLCEGSTGKAGGMGGMGSDEMMQIDDEGDELEEDSGSDSEI